MPTNYKELIRQKLSDKSVKSGGLHVSAIAKHIINDSANLFTEAENFEAVKTKVNNILLADISKKSGNEYSKVKNSKTGKFKRGYYKLVGSVKETKLPVTPIDSMKSPEQPVTIM